MRVLVTGGAGFVGSHLVESLLSKGHTVLVVDNLSTGKAKNLNPKANLVQMDIGSPELERVARDFQPDAFSHCAAQASVAVSMKKPALDAETNIVSGLNVCQAAMASGCSQFVYVTTGGALYGQPEYLPCDEDHPIRPISAYGLSKWTLECYLKLLLPPSVPLKVLRLSNVYGPRQDPNGEAGVVSIFGARMLRGDKVIIFGDGEQTRDFVYIKDVARAHELALAARESLTVNISSGSALSVNELFRIMAAETGYDLLPVHEAERPGDIKHVVLSNARAKRVLKWVPQVSIEQGLKETLDWLRS